MKNSMTLEAVFHEATTDVVIELLPSVNETVMAVGKIHGVTKGSELSISEGNWDTETLHPGKEYSASVSCIMILRITCPCDLYPLTPNFYIVKLGCTGVYIFLIFALKHTLWVLIRMRTHNQCFEQK